MQRVVCVLVATVVAVVASSANAGIVLDLGAGNSTDAFTKATSGLGDPNITSSSAPNTAGAFVVAGSAPGAIAATTSSFNTGTNTLAASYVQSRPGNTQVAGGSAYVNFTVTSNMPFTASGSYANPTGGTVTFFSNLIDNTADPSGFVYSYFQTSNAALITINSLAPGFTGSLTGTLIAGHQYYWDSYVQLESGASGSGSATLQAGSLAAVPEAQSLITWSVVAMALGGIGWYSRSKRAVVAYSRAA